MWRFCLTLELVLALNAAASGAHGGGLGSRARKGPVILPFPPVDHSLEPQEAPPRSQPHPQILSQWTASVIVEGIGPYVFPPTNGSLVYDAPRRRYSLRYVYEFPLFDHVKLATHQIGFNDTSVNQLEDRCLHMEALPFKDFLDIFTTHPKVNFSGRSEVLGRGCDLWTVEHPFFGNLTDKQSLCINGNRPLQHRTADQSITFLNFSLTVDSQQFMIPTDCNRPSPPCGSGKIINQTVYVAHPRSRYSISSQDVADARGDAVFLCRDGYMWKHGGYELLSSYVIAMVEKYSDYGNYPPPGGGDAVGGDQFHVGRECPLDVGHHGGRCEDDAHWHRRIGQWLSLPRAGQCLKSEQLLGKDCTWRIEQRVATIEMNCLLEERGFSQKCVGASAPFDEVTNVLEKAVGSEDAGQGGCPRVREAECSMHRACSHLVGDCCPHQDGTMFACCNASEPLAIALLHV